jgi:hypothetical protein
MSKLVKFVFRVNNYKELDDDNLFVTLATALTEEYAESAYLEMDTVFDVIQAYGDDSEVKFVFEDIEKRACGEIFEGLMLALMDVFPRLDLAGDIDSANYHLTAKYEDTLLTVVKSVNGIVSKASIHYDGGYDDSEEGFDEYEMIFDDY